MVRSNSDRHQNKRVYQPSITSFFSRDASSTGPRSQESTTSQHLTPAIQASLLSVGMRIRKAVPEGYKTHKSALFKDSTIPVSPVVSYNSTSGNNTAFKPRELQPFCGLHKVGGLGIQESQMSAMSSYGVGYTGVNAYAAFDNEFPSSQESDISVTGDHGVVGGPVGLPASHVLAKGGKRRIEDDEGSEDEDLEFDFGTAIQDTIAQYPGRIFAVPRTRRKEDESFSISRENVIDTDFEDADFLKPFGEVQMGGM